MTTVNIGVSHNNNLVVTKSINIEGITDTNAECLDHRHNFFVSKHFIQTSALGVENFTTKRQNRLGFIVSPLFSGASR
ncbi:hypothetical protein D3C73_1391370 [compost metagenome]